MDERKIRSMRNLCVRVCDDLNEDSGGSCGTYVLEMAAST